MPADWRDFLAAVPAEELVQLPLARSFAGAQGAVPRSLAALLARLDQLTLARECAFGGGAGLAAADRHVLAQLARRQSPKKRHECDQLAGLVRELAHADGTWAAPVVDMGCGVGHFASILHQQHALAVLGIDGDAALVTAGDQRLQSLPPVAGTPCQLVSCYVHGPEDLIGVCSAAGVRGAVLTGLHSCGDLTTSMLQAAVAEPAVFPRVAVASCCYHRITPDRFPVSRFMAERLAAGDVDRASLRAACLSPHLWPQDADHLFTKHHYRALLQVIWQTRRMKKLAEKKRGEYNKKR